MDGTHRLDSDQIRDLLEKLGINVAYTTVNEFVAYCPFHENHDSPALNVSKDGRGYKCWNGSCGAQGSLRGLMVKLGYSGPEAERYLKKGFFERTDFEKYIYDLVYDREEAKSEWSYDDLYSFREQDRDCDYAAREYLYQRGITHEAYDHFLMGFSARKRMLTIPVISEHDEPLGIIGRAIDHKQYQYSAGLDRSGTLWNIQNAKQYTSVILTEGALDSVYIWQAGFPSVCAVFGSSISQKQWRIIHKHFDTIVCFFDNDPAGISLTNSIIETQRSLNVQVVSYPDGVKDPGDLTPEQIDGMILNARNGLETIFAL